MGGCKCTYRDCTVKTDGQTHMFHYPVFDRIRCHQWLTNAQRLEFLNLKVSQLKNRVICQHHFRPEVFMNFKMDKLRYDAVPTENGPFCKSHDYPQTEFSEESGNILVSLSLAPEDIENDCLSHKEKKANFSVKYGDFLINSEIDCSMLINPIHNQSKEKINLGNKNINNSIKPNKDALSLNDHKVSLTSEVKHEQYQPMVVEPPYSDNYNKMLKNEYQNTVPAQKNDENRMDMCYTVNSKSVDVADKTKRKKNNGIKIISEKKLSTPFSVKGKLEPVSPSLVICPRDIKKDVQLITSEQNTLNNLENIEVIINNPENNTSNLADDILKSTFIFDCTVTDPQILQANQPSVHCKLNSIIPLNQNNCASSHSVSAVTEATPYYEVPLESNSNVSILKSSNYNLRNDNISNNNQSSPKVSLLKNKIPPERVAAIKEKRNFNKKLRDMIEFCLDDCEKQTCSKKTEHSLKTTFEPLESDEKIKHKKTSESCQYNADSTSNKTHVKSDSDSQIVASHLSKEPKLPILEEYNMASIESRMKKMEDILLRKIEQNSQRIIDLKNTILSNSMEKKTILTQTYPENEDTHKKQLYQQISQYLSPDANSLLYEELFLNKFAKKSDKSPVDTSVPSKRRRRR